MPSSSRALFYVSPVSECERGNNRSLAKQRNDATDLYEITTPKQFDKKYYGSIDKR